MPARQIELDEAIKDGVNIVYNTKVTEAEIKNEEIEKIKCVKTDTSTERVVDIQDSEFYINANSVVFAIGLKPNRKLIESQGLELNENGLIKIDKNCMTNIEGVFAGGDVSQGKATVCMAIKAGKNAAKGIIEFLKL